MTLLLLLLPMACHKGADPVDTGERPVTMEISSWTREGPAPWDGLAVAWRWERPTSDTGDPEVEPVEDDGAHPPLVLDAAGSPVDLVLRPPPYVDTPTWVGEPELDSGTYTLAGVDGEDRSWDETFTVEPWGRDPAFAGQDLTGRNWLLDPGSITMGGVSSIVGLLLEDMPFYLDILSVSDGEATFRMVSEAGDSQCELFTGTGTLSDTGELSWAAPSLDLASSVALPTWDASLSAGFSADGNALAGLTLAFTLDSYALSDAMSSTSDPTDICDSTEGVGAPCGPCPEGEHQTCLDLALYGGRMDAVHVELSDELAPCTTAWDITGWGWACASTGGGPAPWATLAVMGLVATLRRRPQRRTP